MEIIKFKITIYLVIEQNIFEFSSKSKVHENEHSQEKAQCVSWFIKTKSDIRLKFHCAWMSDFVSINQETHWAFSCRVLIFMKSTFATKFKNILLNH